VTAFPRFYIESDVIIAGSDSAILVSLLRFGEADSVAPGIVWDFAGMAATAEATHRFAAELLHPRHDAFHHVLGLKGRFGPIGSVACRD